MAPLTLHSVFHLNLLFSSIPTSDRATVIANCYWPLLRLVRETDAKIAIEATGYTLEEIERIDPSWIAEFKLLILEGKTECIGSGYVQIVGPLVPAEITEKNLAYGHETYRRLLGVSPTIGYINEQTYSSGLVPLYKDAGYEAVIMEWNNAAGAHPEWAPEYRYKLVRAQGEALVELPLLWNDSLVFQKFQRFAHGEIELEEYVEGIVRQIGSEPRILMMYGNDAEIFDFRPGRFHTEAVLGNLHEWERIKNAYTQLKGDTRIQFLLPSEVLRNAREQEDTLVLTLQSSELPIPVKKQEKYNLARWALTGRDSITFNTRCYRVYETLKKSSPENDALWKRLCYAWDSDFRTHLTKERFSEYLDFLNELEKDAGVDSSENIIGLLLSDGETPILNRSCFDVTLPTINAKINVRRGLVLESLTFPDISEQPLLGTLPHGYFDHVPFNADFYSGNTVIDVPGKERITDLQFAQDVRVFRSPQEVIVTGRVPLGSGFVDKRIIFNNALASVTVEYNFSVEQAVPAVFHTGLLSINPEAFDRKTLFYASTNGGRVEEVFSLATTREVRSDPVSLLVSSRTALGNTTGVVHVGDASHTVTITHSMSELAALPIIAFTDTGRTFFLRTAFSLSEFDDTTRLRHGEILPSFTFRMCIGAVKTVEK